MIINKLNTINFPYTLQMYLYFFKFSMIIHGLCVHLTIKNLKLVNKPKLQLDNLIVVGDRVLIQPKSIPDKTGTGLFLPAGYKEKEEIQSGYVVKCGPGYLIPMPIDNDSEPWKQADSEQSRYLPLQAKVGDVAIFLQKSAIEIMYLKEKFFIVPQQAILLLERDEDNSDY